VRVIAKLAVALAPADGEPSHRAGVVGCVFGDDPADLSLGVGRIIDPLDD
jgi:hypothetical protein